LYGTTALVPLFLQTLMGYPAMQSGMAVSPRGFGAIASMILVGRIINKVDSRILIGFGFLVLAYATHLFADINLDITSSSIIWPNVIGGFAMGFIFVPLTTMAMGTLENHQMGNASGVFNLMRNTGGSLGIAAVTTFLGRGVQIHQAAMVSSVNPYNPVLQERVQQLGGAVSGGNSQQAYGAIYGELAKQATVLSYIDNFRLLSYVCIVCVPAVLLFRRVKAIKGPVAMH